MTQETVQLKIGKNTFHVRIPNLMGVAVPAYTPGVPDVRAEIAQSGRAYRLGAAGKAGAWQEKRGDCRQRYHAPLSRRGNGA